MISQDGDKNDQFKYDNGECGVKGNSPANPVKKITV